MVICEMLEGAAVVLPARLTSAVPAALPSVFQREGCAVKPSCAAK